MSIYEVIATGVSRNLTAITAMKENERNRHITKAAKSLSKNKVYSANSGGGVRGTTRLSKLLPIAEDVMRP